MVHHITPDKQGLYMDTIASWNYLIITMKNPENKIKAVAQNYCSSFKYVIILEHNNLKKLLQIKNKT